MKRWKVGDEERPRNSRIDWRDRFDIADWRDFLLFRVYGFSGRVGRGFARAARDGRESRELGYGV
jgi:hypothetical protein